MARIELGEVDLLRHLLAEAREVAVAEHRRAKRYSEALDRVTKDAMTIVDGTGDPVTVAAEIVQRGKGALPWGSSS